MKYVIVLAMGLCMLGSTVYADLKPVTDPLLLTQLQGLEIEGLEKEVKALRTELNQMKEEFKLIKINSGRTVKQINKLSEMGYYGSGSDSEKASKREVEDLKQEVEDLKQEVKDLRDAYKALNEQIKYHVMPQLMHLIFMNRRE